MKLLRVYFGEKDKHRGRPLFEYLTRLAYEEGMKGVTVFKGVMGFGEKRHVHRSDFFSISADLPMVVEIFDTDEKIATFIEKVKELKFDGLVVVLDAEGFHM